MSHGQGFVRHRCDRWLGTIEGGRIVQKALLADPSRLAQIDLAVLND
jgi:hypothetical protein